MDEIIRDLEAVAARCTTASEMIDRSEVFDKAERLLKACNSLDNAWSGCALGYHSRIYTRDFQSVQPGWHFDAMTGSSHRGTSVGNWGEYPYDVVKEEIFRRAGIDSFEDVLKIAITVRQAFDASKEEALPILDALLAGSNGSDTVVKSAREKVGKQESHISRDDFAKHEIGGGQRLTRDMRAANEGWQVPPHVHFRSLVFEVRSFSHACTVVAKELRHVSQYLKRRTQIAISVQEAHEMKKVFIGHGRSPLWRELKDFVTDRLRLDFTEFNREPTAGIANVERLKSMLDEATLALLVLTAEDAHGDGSQHARENVIHEVGLFQGRLGFNRAIVLLEEGCSEFSNIIGLSQLRFPPGKIAAVFEEVRRVLEREGLA